MNYSIGEFSKISGIGIHTLRYYEEESLIIPKRDKNNRRFYSEKDFSWIEFIKRLKDTGMPIKEIKIYAQLRAKGNSTLDQRMKMLIDLRKNLKIKIDLLNEHLLKLDDKIDCYQMENDKL